MSVTPITENPESTHQSNALAEIRDGLAHLKAAAEETAE